MNCIWMSLICAEGLYNPKCKYEIRIRTLVSQGWFETLGSATKHL